MYSEHLQRFKHARRSDHSPRQLGGLPPVVGPAASAASSTQAIPQATTQQSTPPSTAPARNPDPVQPSTAVATAPTRAIPSAPATSASAVLPVTSSAVPVTSAAVATTVPVATVTVPARSSSVPVVTQTSIAPGGSQAFSSGSATLSRLSIGSSSSSASTSTASAGSSNNSNTGITTGAIIGIVAGVLIGVVVLATFIGFCVRRNAKRKDHDDHAFDKDDFRRESILLEDEQEGNQMSEYGAGGLSRGNTSLPGAGRSDRSAPRPPSMILNHYQQQQSFQPGQIFQHPSPPPTAAAFNGTGAYGNPGMDLSGGYPISLGQQRSLDRGLYQQPSQRQSPPQQPYGAQQQSYNQQLQNPFPRPPSANSNSTLRAPPAAAGEFRDLPQVDEEIEQPRSGTPTASNVQQTYFSHAHNESTTSQLQNTDMNRPFGSAQQSRQPVPTIARLSPPREIPPGGEDVTIENGQRAQRTLSVRNGGGRERTNSAESEDDGYGGYA